MTKGKTQMSIWLPDDLARWLRVTAAARGITRSQLVLELIEAEQRENGRLRCQSRARFLTATTRKFPGKAASCVRSTEKQPISGDDATAIAF